MIKSKPGFLMVLSPGSWNDLLNFSTSVFSPVQRAKLGSELREIYKWRESGLKFPEERLSTERLGFWVSGKG